MKKFLFTILSIIPLAAAAQDVPTQEAEEVLLTRQNRVPTGWNYLPLPVIGYNSDLGFQLGGMCDIYYYGDGSVWPDYIHTFNLKASYYFKGSGMFHLFYDSKYLIPKIRTTAAVTYMLNPIMSFYGFNGASSPYLSGLDKNDGIAFYSMKRNFLRILADFQGQIAGDLNWAAGISFWHYDIGEVSLKKYRDNASYSLYNLYREQGIIRENEAGGGTHLEVKAGVVYDTRDHEGAPSRGVWAQVMAYGSPDMFRSGGYNYLKMAAHFHHYISLWGDRIVLAYHLAYQGTLAGSVPFYLQQNITRPYLSQVNSEGLGSITTLRGVLYNRIVGNGYAWGNAELRIRVANFDLAGRNWVIGLNPLFDAGRVVQKYRFDEMKEAAARLEADPDPETAALADLVYSARGEKLHMSAGIGLKVIMDRNFVVSVEWAKPFDRQDGKNGASVGMNYLF